ncbi:TPA: DUF551 domain-containing protein [Proteus mirabilis]|uniref:DUF551 domain-containing protein n=1 Tax=Proteus mirabilis TaxID=584 RepID=A0AAN3YYV3_PROMI|nr:DUF551 domain-containing protein [Proteus mirabilis]EKW9777749.1 DUF551 domain-containing protein [Proteus mirabilis]EMD1500810.1 DUF551 domain-containing protein [Proteus mirabilis]HAT2163772.1 DUF551 domain-containing protein [Proteus mirabilis]HCU0048681.1 DUF551 domain-containing protein [Proteus mirabilis]HEJ9800026.1 DUF551 domain-containing protein [Proteus mirabilis]
MQRTNWVNRNERTPDEDGKYLIYGPRGITTGYWQSRINKFQDAESSDNEGMMGWKGILTVTHWMPLPPMPEGE